MKKKFLVIPIFIPHLGCPHMCVFCNQKKITGKTTNITSHKIKETIEFFLKFKESKDIVEVAFFGGTFTGLPISLQEEFLSSVKPYIERGHINYIRVSTRPDYINHKVLSLLKLYNVKIIELGVQSLIDEVLFLSQRGHTSKDVEKASVLIKDMGFLLGHQLMPGLPGDNKERFLLSVKKSILMKPDMVRIYPTLVLENTELYNMYVNEVYKPISLDMAVSISAISYLYYKANNVNVIRIGLQTTDEINKDNIVGGPYHPSIGELVRSKIFLWMIYHFLKNIDVFSKIVISGSSKDYNYMIGYRGENVKILKNIFKNLSIRQDPSALEENIVISVNRGEYKISLVDFSKKVSKDGINLDEVIK